MTVNAPLHKGLVPESLAIAGRLFIRWRRQWVMPTQSLLFPTLLLITYSLLVSKSMERLTGANGLYGLVPMCAIAGAMFGALGAAHGIPHERDSGLLTRLWVLPVHRASVLTGTLLAEAARTLGSTALITAVGIALGFRFQGGWLAVIAFMLVPVMVVLVFSIVVFAIALRTRSATLLTWVGSAATGMVFCSSGVAPVEIFPSWIQPIIRLQPLSPPIELMGALARGDSPLVPLLVTSAWALGLVVIFGPLAVRGYRTAAETGGG